MSAARRRRRRKRKNAFVLGRSPIALMEEAVHLLRKAPLRVLAMYYVGALPFVLGLLYFWADMSQDAFAYRHCAQGAAALTVLFLWMKVWQAVFMQRLLRDVRGDTSRRWTAKRAARMAVTQTILQPAGMVAVPFGVFSVALFGSIYAFYQNVSVLGDGTTGVGDTFHGAWREAGRWPRQNHVAVWMLSPCLLVAAAGLYLVALPMAAALAPEWTLALMIVVAVVYGLLLAPLSPLGVVVAFNIGVFLKLVPFLLRTILGIDSELGRALGGFSMDSTFFAVVCGLTYLCMDPAMKAVYVLRCFYGASMESGEDLRAALRDRLRAAASTGARLADLALIVAALFWGTPVHAEATLPGAQGEVPYNLEQGIDPGDLDQAIGDVVQQRKYTWRMPRQAPEGTEQTLLGRIMDPIYDWFKWVGRGVGRTVRRIQEWISDLMPDRDPYESAGWLGWAQIPPAVMYVLLAVLLAVLAFWLTRLWRNRPQTVRIDAEAVAPTPDLEDEATTADALPEDGWIAMANDMIQQGQLRLALRALFLATLSHLDQNRFIRVVKHKSNRDYERELDRRAHAVPEVMDAFAENLGLFERTWYGTHPVSSDNLDHFSENQQRIRDHAREP
ncbi:MAG: DUF4129 domain-containing protein [bacterium]|nr:DUF4129 domain-containing protein [bacterium]